MAHPLQETLGKPGAGLPKLHAFTLRYLGFPLLKLIYPWERAFALFESESNKILELTGKLDEKQLFRRVMVTPTFGIEDNSRFYSAAMVLAHLTHVGKTVRNGIVSLSHGQPLGSDVRIEDYKPFSEIGNDIVDIYRNMADSYRSRILNRIGDYRSGTCHKHPWFGCLDAHGWLILSAVHQRVHRRQLEKIVGVLP